MVMVGVSHYHCDAFPPPQFLYGVNVDPRLNHHDHVVNHRKERLTLNRREQKRLLVMNEIEKKVMKVRETAEVLGLSEREGGGYWQLIGRRELRGLPMGILICVPSIQSESSAIIRFLPVKILLTDF